MSDTSEHAPTGYDHGYQVEVYFAVGAAPTFVGGGSFMDLDRIMREADAIDAAGENPKGAITGAAARHFYMALGRNAGVESATVEALDQYEDTVAAHRAAFRESLENGTAGDNEAGGSVGGAEENDTSEYVFEPSPNCASASELLLAASAEAARLEAEARAKLYNDRDTKGFQNSIRVRARLVAELPASIEKLRLSGITVPVELAKRIRAHADEATTVLREDSILGMQALLNPIGSKIDEPNVLESLAAQFQPDTE